MANDRRIEIDRGTTMRNELGVFETDEHHFRFDSACSALHMFRAVANDPDTFEAWLVEYQEHDMCGMGRDSEKVLCHTSLRGKAHGR
jgi:hypothetical protein